MINFQTLSNDISKAVEYIKGECDNNELLRLYQDALNMIYNVRHEIRTKKNMPKKSDFERDSDFYKTCAEIAQYNEDVETVYQMRKDILDGHERNLNEAINYNIKNQMPSHFNDEMKEIILNRVYDKPLSEKSYEIAYLVEFYQDMLQASKNINKVYEV